MKKEIENIVFYKFWDNSGEHVQSCIFYKDGSVENISLEEGSIIASKILKEENITNIKDLNKSKKIHVLTGEKFEEQFHSFIATQKSAAKEELRQKKSNRIKNQKEKKPSVFSRIWHSKLLKPVVALTSIPSLLASKVKSLVSTVEEKAKQRKEKKIQNQKEKRPNIFSRIWHSKLLKPVVAVATSIAMVFGTVGATFAPRKTKTNTNSANSNAVFATDSENNTTNMTLEDLLKQATNTKKSNDNIEFNKLVSETSNTVQAQEMNKIGTFLEHFNINFASKHKEKNIMPALKWDEIATLSLAYNEFSKEEIKGIYNGYELDSVKLDNNYKAATLELLGSFVLETSDTPVGLDKLIDSKDGKDFYLKYDKLFQKCKQTTGKEQIEAVNTFYRELYKDYPISDEIREIGLSHSDSRNEITSYKLSIVPMVGAAEVMFQNLGIDHTLSNKAINYFNDLGLCNYAEKKFEKAEAITSVSTLDNNNPTYGQYNSAKVNELIKASYYNVNDENRDISQLSEFKKWVNRSNNKQATINSTYSNAYSTSSASTTKSQTKTTYKTTTTKTTKSDTDGHLYPEAAKKVDNSINKANQKAQEDGTKKAEETKNNLQKEADKQAETVRSEIIKDDKDMSEKINDANTKINNNQPVKESDFDNHNVNFDNNHSDSNGKLNDSVKDITTDKTGLGEALPDPNKSGAQFDKASSYKYSSNEQIANEVVENMANNPTSYEDQSYQYVK